MNFRIALFLTLFISHFCYAAAGTLKNDTGLSNAEFNDLVEQISIKRSKFIDYAEQVRELGVDFTLVKDHEGGTIRTNRYGGIEIRIGDLVENKPNLPDDLLIILLARAYSHSMSYTNRPKFNQSKPKVNLSFWDKSDKKDYRAPEKNQRIRQNPEKTAYAGFTFSLRIANQMAEKGDIGPLRQAIPYFKKMRKREGINAVNEAALKKVMTSSLWKSSLKVIKKADKNS